jgi:hypothetical protein
MALWNLIRPRLSPFARRGGHAFGPLANDHAIQQGIFFIVKPSLLEHYDDVRVSVHGSLVARLPRAVRCILHSGLQYNRPLGRSRVVRDGPEYQ